MRAISSRFARCTSSVTDDVQSEKGRRRHSRAKARRSRLAADAVRRGCSGEDHSIHAQPAQYQVYLRMKKRGEARLDYAVVLRQNDEFRRKSVGYFGSALLGKRLAALEPNIIAAFFNVAAVRSVMTRGIYHGDASRVAEVYRSGACGDCGRGRGDADGRGREMKPPCISIIINAYFFMTVPFKFLFYTIIAQI